MATNKLINAYFRFQRPNMVNIRLCHTLIRSVLQKFKFCSDGDCPLWALAALHALGSLPAQIFRSLLQHVVEEQPVSILFHIHNLHDMHQVSIKH